MTNTNFNGNQKPPSSPYKDLRTRNVQAAAVAALTANVMAATEIASHAGQTLSNLGMTIHADLTTPLPPSGPAAIAATQRTLELAQGLQPNQSLHTSSLEANPALISQAVINTTPLPTSQQQEVILHRNLNGSISGNLRNLSTSPHPLSSSLITLGAHQALPQPNRPSYRNDNHPANSYANQVERMWRMAQEGQCTDQARDQLLSFAHMTYSKKTSDPCLLPLLHTLARLHPNHLPTLLLLSCVYYSQGDYVSALYYNDQILSIDPDYVEAMSNMGTTQRALGRSAEAEELWWRAITIRPTYLDAFDNLIGVLCNSHSASSSNPQVQGQPRFAEALRLCKFVEAALFGPEELQFRPVRLPSIIPVTDAHRVQNLFYAKGNLLTATNRAALAHEEYVKALEVVLGPPMPKSVSVQDSDTEGYSLVDLVLAVTSIGIFMTALNASETGAPTDPAVLRSLSNTGIWDPNFCGVETVLADPLKAARQRRNVVRNRLLRMGGGILPCVLLLPESLDQLVSTVFSASSRALPVFQNYLTPQSSGGQAFPTRNAAFQSPNHTTSHLLLNMARYLQDASSFSSPGGVAASLDGIPPSPSLLLPLYYVAITLHPSPSTCNNLGILISTIPSSLTIYKRNEGRRVLSAQHVAHTYYIQGLQKDDRHPHLYTNLGSLLKDMGQLPQAVMMYDKAVQFNPNFDVALANLANAIKDMGRVQESVQWYKKAVVINPNFPEAVCGLVNALGGVCDWRDRGAVGNEPVVDVNGKLLGPPAPAPDGKLRAGLMGKVSRLVDRQLDEGISYGKGIMRQVAGLEQWLEAIAIIKTGRSDGSTTELRKRWRKKLEPFFGNLGEARSNTSRGAKFNEGGFLIRLIEQCTRQIQRRMYRDAYGTNLTSTSCTPKVNVSTERKGGTTSSYQRLTLPMALPAPPVPTVLPFHTFTYPLTARECRLISHRNALKISLTTLNQPWIPSAAYPPPPPPFPTDPDGLPRLRVGYVSSDFNNHPLAHLTQSVFGLHDQSRFKIFCYATSTSDDSIYRKKIQDEVEVFKDISTWSCERAVNEIVKDHIHILVNLNGYTKGAKNEVFAARPCPIQMEYMGFAGTLASGWTDWIIADPVVCPPRMVSGEKWRKRHHISHAETHDASTLANSLDRENLPRFLELEDDGPTDFEGHLDPESVDEDWVYTEKFIYMPHSYFVCDHKQGFRDEATQTTTALNGVPINLNLKFNTDEDESHKRNRAWEEEEVKRWAMRKETFPDIDDRTIIFANFNQLYKIDPLVFNYWLEILAAVPNSILWLLRFPAPGEPHLKMTAEKWAGKEVASRIRFTDVASKPIHIQRGRVADLFLDSTECNAHTTAADILWSATPILTLPRPTHAHKMCSRVATSIALATGYGLQMIATSMEDYKNRAINFASTLSYQLKRTQSGVDYRSGEVVPGGLIELRQNLFFSREKSVLFDTARWTKNLEKGYLEAWRRFVLGLDDEESVEWNNCQDSGLKGSCSIWLKDEEEDECVRRVNMARQEFMIRENQLTGSNDPTI
ncbi:UDP-N-acetylglucosaminyltransferase [Phakopsora pachyrhizi]|nr:UDP-N-acetylglucosaminyltransferase [Phakopsora pachyrhizi]